MDENIVMQGRKSYRANKGKMDSPYAFGTPEFDDFERGWVQALKRDSSPTGDDIAYTRMDPDQRRVDAVEAKKLKASAYAKASGG